jgi:hypothetical protein
LAALVFVLNVIKERVHDNEKYSATAEAYLKRRIGTLKSTCHKHRGRKKVLLTSDQFYNVWKKQRAKTGLQCPISGETMTHTLGNGSVLTNISVDRINSSKDYVIGNIQFVCVMANLMKNKHDNKTLLVWSKKIVNQLEKK